MRKFCGNGRASSRRVDPSVSGDSPECAAFLDKGCLRSRLGISSRRLPTRAGSSVKYLSLRRTRTTQCR